jgi:hypothetical protein
MVFSFNNAGADEVLIYSGPAAGPQTISVLDLESGSVRDVGVLPGAPLLHNPLDNTITYPVNGPGPTKFVTVSASDPSQIISEVSVDFGGFNGGVIAALGSQQLSSTLRGIAGSISEVRTEIETATAMTAALDSMMPQPGKTFRVGLDMGTSQGEYAGALNATAVYNNFDFSAGGAIAEEAYAGKVGIGYSW